MYKITHMHDEQDFQNACSKNITQGWIPAGGVSYHSDVGFCQAFFFRGEISPIPAKRKPIPHLHAVA